MSRYHMNVHGNPARCDAKSEESCPRSKEGSPHGDSPDDVQQKFETQNKSQIFPKMTSKSSQNTQWGQVNKHSQETQWEKDLATKHMQHGSDHVVLGDVQNNGENFVIGKTSRSIDKVDKYIPIDSGINISKYSIYNNDGEEIGYVKVSEMTDESLRESYGNDELTGFRYMDRYSGRSYAMSDYGDNDREFKELPEDVEERKKLKRELWLNVARNRELGVFSKKEPYRLTEDDVPDDEQVEKDLSLAHGKALEKMREAKEFHETPSIDYSKIHGDYQGRGLASQLYHVTAKDLGKQGKVLRSSGLQSDDASKIWNKLNQGSNTGKIALKNPNDRGQKMVYSTLDYRGQSSKSKKISAEEAAQEAMARQEYDRWRAQKEDENADPDDVNWTEEEMSYEAWIEESIDEGERKADEQFGYERAWDH